RNTPLYDAVAISGESEIEFPRMTLYDIKLYRSFLNGLMMVKQLYDNLSESVFRELSGDYTFLRYVELIEIRNWLDANFSIGEKFTEQMKHIARDTDDINLFLDLLSVESRFDISTWKRV